MAGHALEPIAAYGASKVHRALAGDTIEIWGNGEVVRDFIYIADAVSGLIVLPDTAPFSRGYSPVFNIGSGQGTSLAEIIALIKSELGRPLCIENKPARTFDVPVSVLDVAKAHRDLGWAPKISLQLSIAYMIGDLALNTKRQFSSR